MDLSPSNLATYFNVYAPGSGPGAGTWALPGGTLEWGEQLSRAIPREVEEETGARWLGLGRVTGVYSRPDRDPRFHAVTICVTAEVADQFVQPLPGTDIAMMLAMMHVIVRDDLIDHDWVAAHTHGFAELAGHLAASRPELHILLLGWSEEEREANAAWPDLPNVIDLSGRLAIPELVRCLAHAELAYQGALEYAKERHAFGKNLAGFQVIRHKLADMATQIAAARALTGECVVRYLKGEQTPALAAMAKNAATDACSAVCDQAVQIHGGYGYMREYVVERLYRDARLYPIGGGTREIMNEIISKPRAF